MRRGVRRLGEQELAVTTEYPSICTDGGAHRVFLPGVRPVASEGGEGPGLELGNPDGYVLIQCVKCSRVWRAFIEWGK